MHRGCDEDLGLALFHAAERGGEGGGDDGVGDAGGELADGVVGGGRDQIGAEGGAVGEVLGAPGELGHEGVAGGPLEGLRADEGEGVAAHEGDHFGAACAEQSGNHGGLHGCDAAADEQGDTVACEVGGARCHIVVAERR